MQFHHYTLQKIADFLNLNWRNCIMEDIFSQNKNELILQNEHSTLRVGCNTPLTYLVPVPDYSKAGKNVANLFPQLGGRKFWKAVVVPFERVIILTFEGGFELILKMHGIQANVMLRKGGAILETFLQSHENDVEFQEKAGTFDEEALESLVATTEKLAEKEIGQHIRTVSPIFDKHFVKRTALHWERENNLKDALQRTIEDAQKGRYVVYKDEIGIHFSLFPIQNGEVQLVFSAIEEALFFFLRTHFQFYSYQSAYNSLKKDIEEPFKKLENHYNSYKKTLEHLNTERSAEEIGHLLMANLHNMTSNMSEIEVDDFYSDGKTLIIKLKKDISPAENAALYYQKNKERKKKSTFIESEISRLEDELLTMEEKVLEYQQLVKPADLLLSEKGLDTEILKSIRSFEKEQSKDAPKTYPFRYYEKEGWQIFVGKSGKNNDDLIKFANKDDLWLHAKDVAGSHVIIRKKSQQSFPKNILEYAAGLAAWYSKSRNQSLVPVIFTPRKFVRKRKGDAAGKVVVDKEEVVLIEPVRGDSNT